MADIVVDPNAPPAPTPATDWRATLPEDLQADKSLERYKGVEDLARGYVNAEKAISGSVRLPPKDAKPEDVAKWKAETLPKLTAAGILDGAPESPEKYQLQRPPAALDGAWSEDAEKGFLVSAHAAGLSQPQAQAVMNYYGKMIGDQLAAAQAEAQRVEQELRTTWGPNYDAHMGQANRRLQEFGGDELVDFLAKSGLGRHPLMIKAWAAVGDAMAEHRGLADPGRPGVGPEEATRQADAMFADPAHPFNNKTHPDHAKAVEDYLALNRIINRGGRP